MLSQGLKILFSRFKTKEPLQEYTKICLYIAVMDDEIGRNELEGNFIGDDEIKFPPRRESLQYRYHMFLEMFKEYSLEELEAEILVYEERLESSKIYLEQKGDVLSVELN